MSPSTLLSFIFACSFSLCVAQSAKAALIDKTWVSRAGNDTNPCTEASPCRTFGGALANTNDGGLISCLDAGEFSSRTIITISVTIDCSETRANHWNNNNGDAINVNAPGKIVILRGIDFTSAYLGGSSLGVNITGANLVIIENCVIRKFVRGIYDHRNEAGGLVVQDTAIDNIGPTNTSGGGITIVPGSGGSVRATLNRVTVAAAAFGIAADGSNSTAGINVTIRDSVSSNNKMDGVIAVTIPGGAPIGVTLINSASVYNNIGVRSLGPNVTVRVEGSKILGNTTGLVSDGVGALLSAGNNIVETNGANGAFSGPVPLK
jgi:hypothetical protein